MKMKSIGIKVGTRPPFCLDRHWGWHPSPSQTISATYAKFWDHYCTITSQILKVSVVASSTGKWLNTVDRKYVVEQCLCISTLLLGLRLKKHSHSGLSYWSNFIQYHWRILGERASLAVQFLSFSCSFWKKIFPNNRTRLLVRGWRPPSGKTGICHWVLLSIERKSNHQEA